VSETDAQQALVAQVHDVVEADLRIVAAWLEAGGLAEPADEDGDLHLHCLVRPDALDEFRGTGWRDLVASVMPVLVAVDAADGSVGGCAVSPGWDHLDLVMHAEGTVDPGSVSGLVPVFDRTGDSLPSTATPAHGTGGQPYFPADVVDRYFYLLGNLAGALGRNEVVLASAGTIARRDLGLVPLMLAENGIRRSDRDRRLECYLDDDQRAVLRTLPPVAADRLSVLAADAAIAREFITRGRALARMTGASWPEAVETATLDHLERRLNVSFGPTERDEWNWGHPSWEQS
jgi:hypothetical protein